MEQCEEGESKWYNAASGGSLALVSDITTHVIKDLQPNRNYKFRVRAKNCTGFGDPTETDKYYLMPNPFRKFIYIS